MESWRELYTAECRRKGEKFRSSSPEEVAIWDSNFASIYPRMRGCVDAKYDNSTRALGVSVLINLVGDTLTLAIKWKDMGGDFLIVLGVERNIHFSTGHGC